MGGDKSGGYITGDINPNMADRVVDVTNICYPDQTFDYVIINHVLEHIKDEKKAMDEIKRVLKRNGKVIFSMPICVEEDTIEARDMLSEKECMEKYGQRDHVRLYGRDTQERMEKYGYNIIEYRADEILEQGELNNMRILAKDRIFIGKAIELH